MCRFPIGWLIALCLFAQIGPIFLHGQISWTAATSDWYESMNWSPMNVPGTQDDAEIDNGGTALISGGSAYAAELVVGNLAEGSLGISGAGVLHAASIQFGKITDSHGTLNLSTSAVIETGALRRGDGTAMLTLGHGTLRAIRNEPEFLGGFAMGEVVVSGGELIIDSNGYDIGITSPVQFGTGGMRKVGNGILEVSGVVSHGSKLRIDQGTLRLTGASSNGPWETQLWDAARLEMSGGATLATQMLRFQSVEASIHLSEPATRLEVGGSSLVAGASNNHENLDRSLLVITSGAQMEVAGGITLGIGFGSAEVFISGNGSLLQAGASIRSANHGANVQSTISVVDGALLRSPGSFIAAMVPSFENRLQLNIGGKAGEAAWGPGYIEAAGIGIEGDRDTTHINFNHDGSGYRFETPRGSPLALPSDSHARITHLGPGTTIFIEDYSSKTITIEIEQGVLQMGGGGSRGSVQGDITNNALLRIHRSTGSDNWVYAGSIAGSGAVHQTGPGVTIFGGDHSYSGDTVIRSGTLIVNGSLLSAGSIVVEGEGRLGGTGSAGNVHLQAGGALAPGASPGTLSISSLLWDGGTTLEILLGAIPDEAHGSLVTVSGAFVRGEPGIHEFVFTDGIGLPQAGNIHPLVTFQSAPGWEASDFSYVYTGSRSGFAGSFILLPDALLFEVIAVPEPRILAVLTGLLFGTALSRAARPRSDFDSPAGRVG